MNEQLFHRLAQIALADNPFLEEGEEPTDPSEIHCEGFETVTEDGLPPYWKCQVEHICFIGDFCMYTDGNGCWINGEDGQIMHGVRNVRQIFAEMDKDKPFNPEDHTDYASEFVNPRRSELAMNPMGFEIAFLAGMKCYHLTQR